MQAEELKQLAVALVAKKRHDQALIAYQRLQELDPTDAKWPHQMGEMYRRLGKITEAIAGYSRAAELYARRGFTLKAIALSKLILSLDAKHESTQRRLSELIATDGARPARGQSGIFRAPPPPPPPTAELDFDIDEDDSGSPQIQADQYHDNIFAPIEEISTAAPVPKVSADPKPTAPGKPAWRNALEQAAAVVGAPTATRAPEPPKRIFGLDPEGPLDSLNLAQAYGHSVPGGIFEIPLNDRSVELKAVVLGEPDGTATTPLFSWLDPASLQSLIERMTVRSFHAGEVVCREGDEAASLFVVIEGKLAVRHEDAGDGTPVGFMNAGDFFGEVGLVTGGPRSATVTAETYTSLFEIRRDVINALVESNPRVLSVILRLCRDRLINSQVVFLEKCAKTGFFEPGERPVFAQYFRLIEAQAGATLIRRGEMSPAFYLVMSGELEVVDMPIPVPQPIRLITGDDCGAMSVVTGIPSSSTVKASSKAWLLAMDRATLVYVIAARPNVLSYFSTLGQTRREPEGLSTNTFHLY